MGISVAFAINFVDHGVNRGMLEGSTIFCTFSPFLVVDILSISSMFKSELGSNENLEFSATI